MILQSLSICNYIKYKNMKIWFKVTALITVMITVAFGVVIYSSSLTEVFGNWTPIIVSIGLIWVCLLGAYVLSGASDIEEED